MMNVVLKMSSLPFLTVLIVVLVWGAVNPVQAGPTRSRFDRSYPTITRLIESEAGQNTVRSIDRTTEANMLERWTVTVPPWHQVAMTLRLPAMVDLNGPIARLPGSSIREPIETEACQDDDDDGEEPTLTDYDYQEWLGARMVPLPDKGP